MGGFYEAQCTHPEVDFSHEVVSWANDLSHMRLHGRRLYSRSERRSSKREFLGLLRQVRTHVGYFPRRR